MVDETATLASRAPPRSSGAPAWYVAVALDLKRPLAPGLRIALEGSDRVVVGRGGARAVRRAGPELRVDLDDPFLSHVHFRLRRDGAAWRLEDAGSKNGTRVRGLRVQVGDLGDRDVIEAGSTFLVVRRTEAPIVERPDGPALATQHAPLEADLAVLARIAPTMLPVLVRGESGTGKELAARAVHRLSGRSGPMVAVNCGALPAGIAEAELFGARRGAFSGAVEDRPGLIRAAAGGTLFLDEIADLPTPAQAALLRVLQEGELRALGAHESVRVDVRVVSATHRDLDELVARERFRGDLLARLSGHVLTLPPLRERPEDLGLVCAELLRRIDRGARERTFTPSAARALFAHDWPGNVRELEHALRSAVARGGAELALEDLAPSIRAAPKATTADGADRRALIVRLLEEHGGNISAVARALGTSRSQLRRLAERFGIPLARGSD